MKYLNKMLKILVSTILICFSAIVGCNARTDMKILSLVIDDGPQALKDESDLVGQFFEFIPHSRVSIGRFIEGNPLVRDVQCLGYLHERYRVMANFTATFKLEGERIRVASTTVADIVISEIETIERLDDGRFRFQVGKTARIRGNDLLRLIAPDENGLGFKIEDANPVDGFTDYIRSKTADPR